MVGGEFCPVLRPVTVNESVLKCAKCAIANNLYIYYLKLFLSLWKRNFTYRHCVWVVYVTSANVGVITPLSEPAFVTVDVEGPVTIKLMKSNLIWKLIYCRLNSDSFYNTYIRYLKYLYCRYSLTYLANICWIRLIWNNKISLLYHSNFNVCKVK